jgi:hypothetical protein
LVEVNPIGGKHSISINAAGYHAFILGFEPNI